jgi:hypothetical protein
LHEADVCLALVPVWEQVLHLYPDDGDRVGITIPAEAIRVIC